MGTMVSMTPQVPASISLLRLGKRPARTQGRTRSQSRPSGPSTRTLWRGISRFSAMPARTPARTDSGSGSSTTSTAPSGTSRSIATTLLRSNAGSVGHSAERTDPCTTHRNGSSPRRSRTGSATPRRNPSLAVFAGCSRHTPTGGRSDTVTSTLAPSLVVARTSATRVRAPDRSPDHRGTTANPRAETRRKPVSAVHTCTAPSEGTQVTVAHSRPRVSRRAPAMRLKPGFFTACILPHTFFRPAAGEKKEGPKALPGTVGENPTDKFRKTDARRSGPSAAGSRGWWCSSRRWSVACRYHPVGSAGYPRRFANRRLCNRCRSRCT